MNRTLGKVAVVGAGAVGAYYGARLTRAGEDVHFLMRRDLAAVRERGLTIRVKATDANETFTVRPAAVQVTTKAIGPVDLIIVGLKATSRDALTDLLPPLLASHTAILLLQNGLGMDEWVAGQYGGERVLGGLCFVCLNRTAPGVVECYHPGSVNLGEFGRPAGDRARAIAEAFRRGGVRCLVSDNLVEARWRKLIWNIPFNGLSITAGGVTTDRILADPQLVNEVWSLMREIQQAAAALGFTIPTAFLERMIDVTRRMGAYQPSSMVDFLEGRSVEVEEIWGEPLRRAQAAGVVMPHVARLYEKLRQLCPG